MEPSLALQAAIRARLVSSSALLALVPAANVRDANGKPSVFPCVLIGEGQTVPGGDVARRRHDVFADLHIWQKEPGVVFSKQVAGAVRAALSDRRWSIAGLHVADLQITGSRFLRDPGGECSHGIVSLSAVVLETAA